MTVRFLILIALVSTVGVSQPAAEANINFHLAIGNHYRVPEREVILIRERRIPDDELPVVFFLAQRARVAPATIVDLRLGGRSWLDIASRYRLGPDVFYVPVTVIPGPPYGKAYGYYKKPRHEWKTIVLADADVVNLVNLRFLSDYHRLPPDRIIEMRGRNAGFVTIHTDLGRGKSVTIVADRDEKHGHKGKGKGKGRDK